MSRPLRIIYFGADRPWSELDPSDFRRRNTCLLRALVNHPEVERVVVVTGRSRETARKRRRIARVDPTGKVRDVFVYGRIPGQSRCPAVGTLNRLLARREILRAAGRGGDLILWCYWPGGFRMVSELGLKGTLIFDADNDLLSCPNLAREHHKLDALITECAQRANLIVAASRRILKVCDERSASRTSFLRNGVELERFTNDLPEPEDLQEIPHPRLIYVGTISQWMDFDLISEISSTRPEWNLVLIGDAYRTAVPEGLRNRANVHFLGSRPASAVPAYIQHSDIGLLTYRMSDNGNADTDSMKLFEYLAAGKPVVSTAYRPKLAEDFAGLLETASSNTEYIAAIDRLLKACPTQDAHWNERRDQFLLQQTWDERGREAVNLIREVVA